MVFGVARIFTGITLLTIKTHSNPFSPEILLIFKDLYRNYNPFFQYFYYYYYYYYYCCCCCCCCCYYYYYYYYYKVSLGAKICISPKHWFTHRSNAFSYEKSCTRTRFETGKGNLEWLLNTLTAKIFAREYSMALVRFSVENIGIHLFPHIFTALDI